MSDTAPSPPSRGLVLGLCGLTIVVVVALSLVLFRDDLEPVDNTPPTTVHPILATDDFDRADAPDLAAPGHSWAEPAGDWAIQDGHAALVEPASEGPNLAILPTASSDGVARVTVTAVEPGWGFAFRVQDDRNYWALVARPDQSAWSLLRVLDGIRTEHQGIVIAPPTDGARIEVVLDGDRIQAQVGAIAGTEVIDDALVDASGLGLFTETGQNVASMAWDDVEMARR